MDQVDGIPERAGEGKRLILRFAQDMGSLVPRDRRNDIKLKAKG